LQALAGETDAGEIADRIERQIFVHRSKDCVRRVGEQNRVAVGGGLGDRLGADQGAGSGLVFDDDLIAALRETVGIKPRLNVHGGAGCYWHDDGDHPRRIVFLGMCESECRQREAES
jgi:hypothetical protein